MSQLGYRRRQDADGTVHLSDDRCSFTYVRPRPGVVVISIRGHDDGQFGTAPCDELVGDLDRFPPVELFVDTTGVTVAAEPVSGLWSAWLRDHRPALKSVSILVRSRFIHLTVEVAKLFSRTGAMIRVYLDPTHFQDALSRAVPGFQLPAAGGA